MTARTVVLALLLSLPAGLEAQQREIRVPGDRAWTETGLRVRAGDRIEVRAYGNIDWGKGEIGPEGTSGGGIFRPLNTSPAGGLIGRIGTTQFFLGDRAEIEAPASGELELGINDDKVGDNSGEFEVRVRLREGDSGVGSGSGFGSGNSTSWQPGDRDDGQGGERDREPRYDDDDDRYRNRDRFWWRGRVDGTDKLVLQGRSLRVQHIDKDPIQRQDHRFTAAIPEQDTDYELVVKKGRGDVRLLQRPSARNSYTAIILVDDGDKGGSDDYELVLAWKRPRGDAGHYDGVFKWRGRVDIGCRIYIQGKTSRVKDRGGKGTQESFADFTRPLPREAVPVSLLKLKGRGELRLVESPSASNDYTAVVEIEDDKGGSDVYDFQLGWRE